MTTGNDETEEEQTLPTEDEIEEVLSLMTDIFGSDGKLLAVGFQNDKEFLETFGSQKS